MRFTDGTLFFKDENSNIILYKVQSFNFRSPSEHTINGVQYDLEM